jgi:putative Holliday junction resolvase
MRYLAIDPGGKRTGLATGDDQTQLVGPIGLVESTDPQTLLRAIAQAIDEHAIEAVVVGLPLNMDGTQGPAAKRAEALAQLLEAHSGLPVHRFDERLSSYQADQDMRQSGYTRKQKKQRRDALAAAAILRDFFEAQRADE